MKVPTQILLFALILAAPLAVAVRSRAVALAPETVSPEQRMFDLYRTKKIVMGVQHAKEVLASGKWTRYYAEKVGLDQHMETLLCLWHVESEFRDIPGVDGLSFGRAQTRYGYQPRLREWWLARGERLDPSDHAISTQIAFGIAEFYQKYQKADGELFQAVTRYNGCGTAAVNHAKKVFHSRQVIYGLRQPKSRPFPCPIKKPKPQ